MAGGQGISFTLYLCRRRLTICVFACVPLSVCVRWPLRCFDMVCLQGVGTAVLKNSNMPPPPDLDFGQCFLLLFSLCLTSC